MEVSDCALCLEPLVGENHLQVDDNSSVTALPCGHPFHHACLCELVRASASNRCPLCREPFVIGTAAAIF